jgi:hypothetical protein
MVLLGSENGWAHRSTHQIGPKNILLEKGRGCLKWQPAKKAPKEVKVPVIRELVAELNAGAVHPDSYPTTM